MNALSVRRFVALGMVLMAVLFMGNLTLGATSGGGNTTVTITDAVAITVTQGTANFPAIAASDLGVGTVSLTGAWTLQVDAISNFTVDAKLTSTATDSGTAGIVAPAGNSLKLAASLAGGSSAVTSTAFSSTLPATISLNSAFSGTNNANGTGESSTIDLVLDLSQLGDRETAETLTYTLSFVVTEA